MNKLLLGLGIATPVYSAFVVLLSSGPAVLLMLPLLTLVAGIVFTQLYRSLDPDVPVAEQRRLNSYAIGLGVALALLAILGVFGIAPVTGENVDTSGIYGALSTGFIVSLGLLLPAAILVYYWDDYEPRWLRIAMAAVLFLAVVAIFAVDSDQFGSLSAAAILPAILCVAAAAPAALRWRAMQTD